MTKILIDLTPVRPGGENGGAKLMVLELIRQLGLMATQTIFVLLTAHWSHEELGILDSGNIRRLCVISSEAVPALSKRWSFLRRCVSYLKRLLFKKDTQSLTLELEALDADLLFCPFTAPFFKSLNVPMVSVIYDLQCLDYPYFFSNENRVERYRHFQQACQYASYLICISTFTHNAVLKYSPIALRQERVRTIPIYLSYESVQHKIHNLPALLKQYNLCQNDFLLYPANFWKHKNHKMLLTAFSMYVKKHPQTTMKLLCTGALEEEKNKLLLAADIMGLRHYVVFSGYVSTEALFGFFVACKALIFPSLYEGFGIPVIEAMLAGKPVLCSRGSSLCEVGGDTAFYFDPRKPHDIVAAIEKLLALSTSTLNNTILLAYQEALNYLGTDKMAKAYYDVFQQAMSEKKASSYQLTGCFEDGWGSASVVIHYSAAENERFFEADLHCPASHPAAPIRIKQENQLYVIQAGETLKIRQPIALKQGKLTFSVENGLFQPMSFNIAEDSRWLSCLWQRCEMISEENVVDLLKNGCPIC